MFFLSVFSALVSDSVIGARFQSGELNQDRQRDLTDRVLFLPSLIRPSTTRDRHTMRSVHLMFALCWSSLCKLLVQRQVCFKKEPIPLEDNSGVHYFFCSRVWFVNLDPLRRQLFA